MIVKTDCETDGSSAALIRTLFVAELARFSPEAAGAAGANFLLVKISPDRKWIVDTSHVAPRLGTCLHV